MAGKAGRGPRARRADADVITAALHSVTLDTTGERGPAELRFTWDAPDGAIVALEIDVRLDVATVTQRLPADVAGLRGVGGKCALPIDLALLPAGKAQLGVCLIGHEGALVERAWTDIEVPGVQERRERKPIAVRAECASVQRPRDDDGVTWVLGRIPSWQGDEHTSLLLGLAGPDEETRWSASGTAIDTDADVPLVAIDATFATGKYRLTGVLVHRDGSIDTLGETWFEVASKADWRGPSIAGWKRNRLGQLTLSGDALSGPQLRVEFDGVPAAVVRADPSRLVIEPPALDHAAVIRVEHLRGRSGAAALYQPPVSVRIVPGEIALPDGGSVQLTAVVSGTRDGRVAWFVRDGGDGVRIDETGRLSATLGTKADRCTVVARSLADDAVSASATVTLAPRVDPPDGQLARLGGRVSCPVSGASLDVPAGALRKAGRITVRAVPLEAKLRKGAILLASAEITGPAQKLSVPATLHLPLRAAWPMDGGVIVEVSSGRGPWMPLPIDGPSPLDPRTLDLSVLQLPLRVRVYQPFNRDHAFPRVRVLPTIASLSTTRIDEGDTIALIAEGTNFVPGLTTVTLVDVDGLLGTPMATLDQFQPGAFSAVPASSTRLAVEASGTPRVEFGQTSIRSVAVTADATKVGIALKVGIFPSLGEGQTGRLSLRITTPAGTAESWLTVIGHDELILLTGSRTISASARFSTIVVGPAASLLIEQTVPPVEVEAYETVWLASQFEQGGGVRALSNDGMRGTPGAIDVAYGGGGAGGAGYGATVRSAGGTGGRGGLGSNSSGDPGGAGAASVTLSMPGAGGMRGAAGGVLFGGSDGGGGLMGRRSQLFSTTLEVQREAAPGGGGGGGGGGWGWPVAVPGSGGGGGGSGGGVVMIAAAEGIMVAGDVLALGGDGAQAVSPAGGGGGMGGPGGSGGGGAVVLHGTVPSPGSVIAARGATGARPRLGPTFPAEGRTLRQQIFDREPDGDVEIGGVQPSTVVGQVVNTPDVAYVPNLLALHPTATVLISGGDRVRVRDASGQLRTATVSSTGLVPVTLAPGVNEVTLANWLGWESPALRARRFVFLPNTTSVFAFNATITPATAIVPTERQLRLTAAVTSTPVSPLTWRVMGGADQGSVVPTRTGTIATYTAPSRAVAAPVTVRVESDFDARRFGAMQLTVVPGIALVTQAQSGTASDPSLPSANVGQLITIEIPAAVFAQTAQGFTVGGTVHFEMLRTVPGGSRGLVVYITANVLPGLTQLEVRMPDCDLGDIWVRVPGHGSQRMLVVPVIYAVTPAAPFPAIYITGSGFDPEGTTVAFNTGTVRASDVTVESSTRIRVAVNPGSGGQVVVTTAGGSSAVFVVP